MIKKINDLPSGSITSSSLGLIGDPSTGTLFQTDYNSLKTFFQSGNSTTLDDIVDNGGNITTGSINVGSFFVENESSSPGTSTTILPFIIAVSSDPSIESPRIQVNDSITNAVFSLQKAGGNDGWIIYSWNNPTASVLIKCLDSGNIQISQFEGIIDTGDILQVNGGVNIGMTNTSPSGSWLKISPSTIFKSSLNIPSGLPPNNPVDGDIWYDQEASGSLKMQISGIIKTFVMS